MTPGKELDVEVTRKVLESVVLLDSDSNSYKILDRTTRKLVDIPEYSTDAKMAHNLLSIFKSRGCTFAINCDDDGVWSCTVSHSDLGPVKFVSVGSTLPHALCMCLIQHSKLFRAK